MGSEEVGLRVTPRANLASRHGTLSQPFRIWTLPPSPADQSIAASFNNKEPTEPYRRCATCVTLTFAIAFYALSTYTHESPTYTAEGAVIFFGGPNGVFGLSSVFPSNVMSTLSL